MNEKKIILAVDDGPENLKILGTMLEKYFDVRLAKSTDMALNILSRTKVDLILLDIVMPEMSGFEFLNLIRSGGSINKKTPIIFITSHADADIIGRAIKSGVKDYIVKPIVAEILYKKIDSIIGLSEHIPGIIDGKLHKLSIAVDSANNAHAESIINELLTLSKGIPHIYNPLEEIAKLIFGFEYKEVKNKINILKHLLDLERIPQ